MTDAGLRPPLHPVVAAVTERIVRRSTVGRAAYLAFIDHERDNGPANFRHRG